MARLGENCYGKSRVRLSRITRHEDRHDFNEWTVGVLLEGEPALPRPIIAKFCRRTR